MAKKNGANDTSLNQDGQGWSTLSMAFSGALTTAAGQYRSDGVLGDVSGLFGLMVQKGFTMRVRRAMLRLETESPDQSGTGFHSISVLGVESDAAIAAFAPSGGSSAWAAPDDISGFSSGDIASVKLGFGRSKAFTYYGNAAPVTQNSVFMQIDITKFVKRVLSRVHDIRLPTSYGSIVLLGVSGSQNNALVWTAVLDAEFQLERIRARM